MWERKHATATQIPQKEPIAKQTGKQRKDIHQAERKRKLTEIKAANESRGRNIQKGVT